MHKHSQFIDALGGTTKLAAALGQPHYNISKWRKNGIPAHHFLDIIGIARKKRVKGITLTVLHETMGLKLSDLSSKEII